MPHNHRIARRRVLYVLLVSLVLIFGLIWSTGKVSQVQDMKTLVLYCFSTMQEAINDGIIPAFQVEWEQKTGERIEFITSFAGSGTITNQIIRKLQPEIAILSSELDALRLREHGIRMIPSWHDLPFRGVVTTSPLVFVVRHGNPLKIHDYENLLKKDIQIILADPRTSGGAQWAILAAYASYLRASNEREHAARQLNKLWQNVHVCATHARGAHGIFEQGTGDVLITYEQDAIGSPTRKPIEGEIIYPPRTIRSEHIIMSIDRNIGSAQRDLVRAFIDFLWTEKAQRIFVAYGFRSAQERLNRENKAFGAIDDLLTLADLGGAKKATQEIIEPLMKNYLGEVSAE